MNHRIATAALATAAAVLLAGPIAAQTQTETIQANASDGYAWTPETTGDVIISIDGDGDSNLDLTITDDAGNVMGTDTSNDDNELVRFRANAGTQYTIQITNLGAVANEYELEMSYVDQSVSETAQPNQTINYDYRAPRGTGQVTTTLHGDGSSDLDLRIYDSRGRMIVQNLSLDDHERVTFDCDPGEQYRIEVRNLAATENAFTLDIEE